MCKTQLVKLFACSLRSGTLDVGILELVIGLFLAVCLVENTVAYTQTRGYPPAHRVAFIIVTTEALVIVLLTAFITIYGALKNNLVFIIAAVIAHLIYLVMHATITIVVVCFGILTVVNWQTITGTAVAVILFENEAA